ncbi:uncharacterized protein F4822DRAFT_325399 [Hypoxylon trugodes]|uniref:uncharacterized protein n=1 Tax=Hypoxylon trugodes TaxID=326681 RepID=UPI00218E45F4|nr:uncharacterized protein F4822DRAFT_325399 [Hypoxylon trugodes]KAI1386738.1 hypothetical protein F4822DRAFT_325399 [Hypoxylon trugodes]
MGGQFTPYDPLRCPHYAQFASGLDRIHFDGIYWTFFFTVIGILFVSSWIYQSTMMYKEKPEYNEVAFRRKLKSSLAWCTSLFLVAAVLLVIEVFALLALQFCDGEDLMSLYWSTWTMLQLGSEIAILGIVMALWHNLCNFKLPLWTLALGTPVLVVAGIGHVIHVAFRMLFKKAKAKRQARKSGSNVTSAAPSVMMTDTATACSVRSDSVKPEQEHTDQLSVIEAGRAMRFMMDVGDDERVKQWPSFVGMADGKAIVQMTVYTGSFTSEKA